MGQIIAFILYFAVVLGIGIYFFLRSKSGGEKEYFLGGRSMGPWVTAMSAQASDMSGWLLMGFPGSILAFGMGQVWIGIGLALGTALNWIVVAKRLRRFSSAANDSITLPQYLTNRFASKNPVLKIVCAIIFLISFTVYVASAFNAGTTVFVAVLPKIFSGREELAMIIFAILILCYTFLGGYKAVCWTDFFQGLLMLVALLAVPIVMVAFGDFDASKNEAFTAGVTAFSTNPFNAPWHEIVSGLAWGLGYFGMPHILVRFMAIENSKKIKKASTVAISWLILTLGAAIAIAYFGRTYLLSDGVALADKLLPGNQARIFIEIVLNLFPGFIAGILLAAIVAASMSTADSQLLVASSSFTSDIYNPILRKGKASDKETLWIGRIVVAIIAVVAFFIARSGLSSTDSWASSIMSMVENAWGLFGASFGPVVILSLFWKRFNYPGAVAGIVSGALVDILWLVLFTDTVMTPVICDTQVYEIFPGFIISAIVAVAVTLLTKAPSQEVCAIFDKALDEAIDD
ncbi:MAG: sodium/proline symporter [Ruminococcaceae bacterium]|nr:sodium/proline symporter [Oscillospiraceae bacterium]